MLPELPLSPVFMIPDSLAFFDAVLADSSVGAFNEQVAKTSRCLSLSPKNCVCAFRAPVYPDTRTHTGDTGTACGYPLDAREQFRAADEHASSLE